MASILNLYLVLVVVCCNYFPDDRETKRSVGIKIYTAAVYLL